MLIPTNNCQCNGCLSTLQRTRPKNEVLTPQFMVFLNTDLRLYVVARFSYEGLALALVINSFIGFMNNSRNYHQLIIISQYMSLLFLSDFSGLIYSFKTTKTTVNALNAKFRLVKSSFRFRSSLLWIQNKKAWPYECI